MSPLTGLDQLADVVPTLTGWGYNDVAATRLKQTHRGTIRIMRKEISVAEFVARPIDLLEEAAMTREEIVIVRDGKPLGKLVPMPHSAMTLDELRNLRGRAPGDNVKLDEDAVARRQEGLQRLRGSVKILGDIVEPIDWNEIE